MRRQVFQKDLRGLANDLQRREAMGLQPGPRQQQRIDQLRAANSQQLNRHELNFLDQVGQRELRDAEMRRDLRDAEELRGFQKQVAQGTPVDNNSRFQELLGAENRRRSKASREKAVRNLGRGSAIAGVGALGLGGAGLAVAAQNGGMGLFPFSSAINGDDEVLAAQQFRIAKELEEREFQNQLAQRTAVAQTDLDNDMMTMQQKTMFQADLERALKAKQMQGTTQGAGVDIVSKIDALAAGYMNQGIEPQKAFTLAQQTVSMDGRANEYL